MFEVIGERINTSRKRVQEAVARRNSDYIINDVKKQQEAGADYIDVNAGARIGHEAGDMEWLIDTIKKVVTTPLCLDSPDPSILEVACSRVDMPPMINSISLEKDRFGAMMPFLEGRDCKIIALCMDDRGMPDSAAEVVSRAARLITELESIGLTQDNIYVDPLIQPVSTDTGKGIMVLDSVMDIRRQFPSVHICGGLSNISFGLPERRIINRTFLSLMMAAGMDSAIIDPLETKLMATVRTAEMLMGHDNYCMNFLAGVRSGRIRS